LLSFHDGVQDFDAIGLPLVATFPADHWRLVNPGKFIAVNPEKHATQRAGLALLLA